MPDSGGASARYRSSERLTFFTDAVVAIAMTLLILPLLEGISDASREGLDTTEWVGDHGDQLFSFVLSFVIIAMFWVNHERLFDVVARQSPQLLLLNIVWMVSIVFLPVATALVGSMEADPLQYVLYIGTMALNSLVTFAMTMVVRRTPELWEDAGVPLAEGAWISQGVMTVLFAVALVLSLAVPAIGYFSLFVLLLTGPLTRLARSRLSRRRPAPPPPRPAAGRGTDPR